jgi:kynurenine formamidase
MSKAQSSSRIRYKLLSYPLTRDTQEYGGKRAFRITRDKNISKGDSCNTFALNMPNHIGTHIDCPGHFFKSGKRILQYGTEEFIFLRPFVMDCPKEENELVTAEDIEKTAKRLKDKDILICRTGFYKYRKKERYALKNPGISPEAAEFIRKELGNIRCVGIDTISVSPYQDRPLGRETHKMFFKDTFKKNRPVRLIEDMDLSGRLDDLKEVHVFPLLISYVDSSPCSVLGFLGKR